jgi:hypothetical protein
MSNALPYKMHSHTDYAMGGGTRPRILWDGYVVLGPDGRTAFKHRSLLKARAWMDAANNEEIANRRRDAEREPVAAHAACEQDDAALVLARPDQFETV